MLKLPKVIVERSDSNMISVRFAYSAILDAKICRTKGAIWNGLEQAWQLPADRESALAVKEAFSGCEITWSYVDEPDLQPEISVDPLVDHDLSEYVFKTQPFAHQRKMFRLTAASRRFALLCEMGTGKTKAAIDAVSYWIQKGEVTGALIFCPKSCVINWGREISTHSPLENPRVALLHGSTVQKLEAVRSQRNAHFFVTNYASLISIDFIALISERRLALIFDESTEIKNPQAKSSKEAFRLSTYSQHKVIMTGTPITQGPLDSFSQFRVLDPAILGHRTFTSFRSEYAILNANPRAFEMGQKQILGYQNLDRLQKRLASHSFRVLKKDCLDLPEKLYRVVEVAPGPKQLKAYRSMRDENIAELAGSVVTATTALTRLLRLQQITSGFLSRVDEYGNDSTALEFENPKLEACAELIDEALDQGRKVIVWCRFLRDVEAVRSRFAEVARAYHGGTSAEDRQGIVDSFQTGDCKIFVGQISAGGIGITLTAATLEIYFSNSFSLEDRLQSEDRAHRIGQKSNVDIVDLEISGTIDRFVRKSLLAKKNLADLVTGDNLREAMGDA